MAALASATGATASLYNLLLGALVGPSVIDAIHLPRLLVRLIWLLLIAVGLPALLWFLCTRARTADVPSITRRAVFAPLVLASAAGTVALGATWAVGATLAALLGQDRPLNLTVALAHWLVGQGRSCYNRERPAANSVWRLLAT